MLISFVIPTRNRLSELSITLEQLQKLNMDDLGGQAEVIVVDNGSHSRLDLPAKLTNGLMIQQVHLDENIGAGARNVGVEHAHGDWVIMLDDDSNLRPGEVGAYLDLVDPALGAIGGEIYLPDGSHEAGGLPEVIVGCGCAIRRDAFLEVGGYDASFGYYAEEYDLCAKLIAGGYTVGHCRSLQFDHRKCSVGRHMDQILYRLVRNNGWVIKRFAPDKYRQFALDEMLTRYELIAVKEQAVDGYRRGCAALESTIDDQKQQALNAHEWDRFTGASAVRSSLSAELSKYSSQTVSIVGPACGKGLGLIQDVIESCGFSLDCGLQCVDSLEVIGTLSPGPMIDARSLFPAAITPWEIESSSTASISLS